MLKFTSENKWFFLYQFCVREIVPAVLRFSSEKIVWLDPDHVSSVIGLLCDYIEMKVQYIMSSV